MPRPDPSGSRPGSIIVLVMVTLLFTAAAVVAFMDRAENDLLVQAREVEAARLRPDAYSALAVTLGVLDDFISADQGLRHPSEGWADPLTWAGWTPPDGATVDVSFQDESGKMPLRYANSQTLLNLFQYWGLQPPDAQKMTDEILSWMSQSYSPVTVQQSDYEQNSIPYDPPYRYIRSIDELAAIDGVRDYFYTDGRPNAWWWRFYNDFSIYNYRRPNVNGANSDVLTALGQFTLEQQQELAQYLAGTSSKNTVNRTWFQAPTDLAGVIGSQTGNPGQFAYTISALRITLTVHEGRSLYRLSVVVSPAQGQRAAASAVMTTATDVKQSQQNATTGETNNNTQVNSTAQPTESPNAAQQAAAQATNIQYPWTFLDVKENDAIVTPPPVPPPDAATASTLPPINPFSAVVPPLPITQ